jgi:hypothetical protein
MNDQMTIPTPDEIAARIRACREELSALRKLQRLVRAADAVQKAQERNMTPARKRVANAS